MTLDASLPMTILLEMNPLCTTTAVIYVSLIKKMEINHDELHRGVEFFLYTYMSMSYI